MHEHEIFFLLQKIGDDRMSQKIIQALTPSRNSVPRTKSPVYICSGPAKQQYFCPSSQNPASNMGPHKTQFSVPNQNMLKNIPMQALEFSTSRKLKFKCPKTANFGTFFNGSGSEVATTRRVPLSGENITARINNENRQIWGAGSKADPRHILKAKSLHSEQVKVFMENHRNLGCQSRERNYEKERNIMREDLAKVKSEFISIRTYSDSENSLKNLAQVEKYKKAYEIAEMKIATLTQERDQREFDLGLLKEQHRKANARILELQCELLALTKQNEELNHKIQKSEQLQGESKGLLKIGTVLQAQKSSNLRNSFSSSILSSSSNNKQKMRHYRSTSNTNFPNSQPRISVPQLLQIQQSIDLCKEFEKYRQTMRKIEKTIRNQNQSIIVDNLRKLNTKYQYVQVESSDYPLLSGDDLGNRRDSFISNPGQTRDRDVKDIRQFWETREINEKYEPNEGRKSST